MGLGDQISWYMPLEQHILLEPGTDEHAANLIIYIRYEFLIDYYNPMDTI